MGPWPRLLVIPLLLVVLGTLMMVRLAPDLVFRLAHCPLRDLTGIPCPTCGGTHCLVSLMQGHFLESLVANPLIFVGTLVFLLWALYALTATAVPQFRRSLSLSTREKRAARWGTALVLVATWIWEFRQLAG